MIKLNYFWEVNDPKKSKITKYLKEGINQINKSKTKTIKANVIFVSNQKIKRLNKIYRKQDQATDVLSFNLEEDERQGDIYLAIKVAAKQAKEQSITTNERVIKLVLHGLLHLSGYDHQTEKDWKKMEIQSEKMLKRCLKT